MPRQRLVPSVAGHYQRACRVSDYAASKRPLHWPADATSASRGNKRVLLAVQLQVFADRRTFPSGLGLPLVAAMLLVLT
ncbi:hypothetical protein ACLKA6_020031 [Drosophila palustris]